MATLNEDPVMTTSPAFAHLRRLFAAALLVLTCLSLSGCSGNVGVGVSVGVPIGDYGYISVGSGRRFF